MDEAGYFVSGIRTEKGPIEGVLTLLDAVTPWRELTQLAGSKISGHSLGQKFYAALVRDWK